MMLDDRPHLTALAALSILAACEVGDPGTTASGVDAGSGSSQVGTVPSFEELCDTEPTEPLEAEEAALDATLDALPRDSDTAEEVAARGRTTIGVVYHLVSPSIGHASDLSRSQVRARIRRLNRQFAGSALRFELKAITRTTSATWFHVQGRPREESRLKRRLHRGSPRTLNVYSTGDGGGWGTFPWNHARYGTRWFHDGVVVNWSADVRTLLVHEVGHWLGLFHTFEGGSCHGKGDRVRDTPTHLDIQFVCQRNDTCPGRRGLDPATNYMNYTGDDCKTRFSRGQRRRMRHFENFRQRAGGSRLSSAADGDLTWVDTPPAPGEEPWPVTTVEIIDGELD